MIDIQRADPAARRYALMLVLGAVAVGLPIIWFLQSRVPALEAWLAEDPAEAMGRIRLLVVLTGGIFAIPTLIFAAQFWKQGEQIVRAGRFPAPSMRVVRDTLVVHGPQARARGRALQVLAVSFAVLDMLVVAVLWHLAGRLAAPGT